MSHNLTITVPVNTSRLSGFENTVRTLVEQKISSCSILLFANGTAIGHLYGIRDRVGGGLEVDVSVYDDTPIGSSFRQAYDAGQVTLTYNFSVVGNTKGNGDYSSVSDIQNINVTF